GHHGGAWKVAYADFVTAMMAFFLLMWLLNATTEDQLRGLSDYFSPDIPLSRVSGGSNGMFGGDMLDAARNGGASADDRSARQATETIALTRLEDVLLGRGGESLLSHRALRHVVTRLTDEGLVIELYSLPDAALFDGDGTEPTAVLSDLVTLITRLADTVTNPVAIGGHTAARPVVLSHNPVWDISSGRADRVRRMMEEANLEPSRLRRVTGHGDRSPAARNPVALRNDRIEIIFLRDVD
ncbi:MAG: flagellar motor protein MotB, partial [Rubellimicrobium sp.]|nr:flagellar motor protein MotB [Rubellimicrobium sp.]